MVVALDPVRGLTDLSRAQGHHKQQSPLGQIGHTMTEEIKMTDEEFLEMKIGTLLHDFGNLVGEKAPEHGVDLALLQLAAAAIKQVDFDRFAEEEYEPQMSKIKQALFKITTTREVAIRAGLELLETK